MHVTDEAELSLASGEDAFDKIGRMFYEAPRRAAKPRYIKS
jgi:hypothetical protein